MSPCEDVSTHFRDILVQDVGHHCINVSNVYEVLASKEKLLLVMLSQGEL